MQNDLEPSSSLWGLPSWRTMQSHLQLEVGRASLVPLQDLEWNKSKEAGRACPVRHPGLCKREADSLFQGQPQDREVLSLNRSSSDGSLKSPSAPTASKSLPLDRCRSALLWGPILLSSIREYRGILENFLGLNELQLPAGRSPAASAS